MRVDLDLVAEGLLGQQNPRMGALEVLLDGEALPHPTCEEPCHQAGGAAKEAAVLSEPGSDSHLFGQSEDQMAVGHHREKLVELLRHILRPSVGAARADPRLTRERNGQVDFALLAVQQSHTLVGVSATGQPGQHLLALGRQRPELGLESRLVLAQEEIEMVSQEAPEGAPEDLSRTVAAAWVRGKWGGRGAGLTGDSPHPGGMRFCSVRKWPIACVGGI